MGRCQSETRREDGKTFLARERKKKPVTCALGQRIRGKRERFTFIPKVPNRRENLQREANI